MNCFEPNTDLWPPTPNFYATKKLFKSLAKGRKDWRWAWNSLFNRPLVGNGTLILSIVSRQPSKHSTSIKCQKSPHHHVVYIKKNTFFFFFIQKIFLLKKNTSAMKCCWISSQLSPLVPRVDYKKEESLNPLAFQDRPSRKAKGLRWGCLSIGHL